MAEPKLFKKIRLRLTTITPLHIGGASGPLDLWEYVFLGDRVHVLSAERLAEKLHACGKLDLFTAKVKEMGKDFRLGSFLEGQGLLNAEFLAAPVTRYTCGCAAPLEETSGTYRPFVRDGLDRPYIPGAPVKGALRHAILYCLLKKVISHQGQKDLDLVLSSKDARLTRLQASERAKKRVEGEIAPLDHQAFQRFNLAKYLTGFDAHTDVFRAIKIRDLEPLDKNGLQVKKVKVLNTKFRLDVECLTTACFTMTITVDQPLLDRFIRGNPSLKILGKDILSQDLRDLMLKPLDAFGTFASAVISAEKTRFSSGKASSQEPNMHLGWGGGLLYSGLCLFLSEETRKQIRNACYPRKPSNAVAPKTRRLLVGEDPPFGTLGWLKAKEVS